MELDAAVVEQAMKALTCQPRIAAIIEDCKVLANQFFVFTISHVRRNANVVARSLASHSIDFRSFEWWDVPPHFISHVLLVDSRLVKVLILAHS